MKQKTKEKKVDPLFMEVSALAKELVRQTTEQRIYTISFHDKVFIASLVLLLVIAILIK